VAADGAYGRMTCHDDRAYGNDVAVTRGSDVGQSAVDTWHSSSGCKGATWPNHGLPRGTPGLANMGYIKNICGPGDSNPGPPPPSTP
jgi:hypothetical protein